LLPLNDFDLTRFSGRTYPGEVVAMVSKMLNYGVIPHPIYRLPTSARIYVA